MSLFIRSILFSLCVALFSPLSSAGVELDFEPLHISPPSKVLTTHGKNRHPLFISENAIIFISKDRHYHQDPQIYFKDLKNGRERRITHQKGHIINGMWFDKNKKLFMPAPQMKKKKHLT